MWLVADRVDLGCWVSLHASLRESIYSPFITASGSQLVLGKNMDPVWPTEIHCFALFCEITMVQKYQQLASSKLNNTKSMGPTHSVRIPVRAILGRIVPTLSL